MGIIKKLTSLALAMTVVIGCGAVVSADSNRLAINSRTFPDSNFRKYVSTNLDLNKDGYISLGERGAQKEINIFNSDIRSVKGVEYLYIYDLNIVGTAVEEIDLTGSISIENVFIQTCGSLRSFTGSMYLNDLEINFCDRLKTIDVSNSKYLKRISLVNDTRLNSTLDLSANRYLNDITVYRCETVDTIKFDPSARPTRVNIQFTPLTSMDLRILDVNKVEYFTVATDGTMRSMTSTGAIINFLWNHRSGNGYRSYENGHYIVIN